MSLHGGLPGSWPQPLVTAKTAVEALLEHWREFGRPAYAQFDNDTIFQGGYHGRDALGRVVRTCLRLDVIPVFAPPQGSGFQAAVETFNGRWQAKVWARFYHDALTDLQERSRRYLRANHQRAALRIEAAPQRRPFPASWQPDLQARPDGTVIFIRRTSETGAVRLLGRTFEAIPSGPTAWSVARWTSVATRSASMRFAAGSRITSRSCAWRPTSSPENTFTSDREAMALAFESCVL